MYRKAVIFSVCLTVLGCSDAQDGSRSGAPSGREVSWEKAVKLLEQCKVIGIFQAHDLTARFVLRNGSSVWFKQPKIDAVIEAQREAANCGDQSVSIAIE